MIEPNYGIVETDKPDAFFYAGDCRAIMQDLISEEMKFKLIFADPPFNNDSDYGPTWDDNLSAMAYLQFVSEWISLASQLLADNGSIFIHVNDKWIANHVIEAESRGLTLINWIIWHYRFGQNQKSKLTISKAHCTWFVKDRKNYQFFPDLISVPTDRATFYDDWREDATGLRVPFDVWGFEKYWGRIQGNNAERRAEHDNQLPEAYLERIIKMTTKEGDWVFDPFCGSGTTATVAHALGRKVSTCDVSEYFARSAYERTKKGLAR